MITGEMKNKVDSIWTTLWTEGSTNPLTNIEQLTYLLFMKDLDEAELVKEKDAELLGVEYTSIFPADKPEYRWNQFKQLGSAEKMFELMQQEIFPFIKTLGGEEDSSFSKYMKDAIFQINKPSTLQKVVSALDGLPTQNRDTQGDLYEYLLSKLETSGTNGQFRTPRHIIRMIVDLMKPSPQDIIIDPAMGSAGFLVAASDYMREHHNDLFFDEKLKAHYHGEMFHGNDMDSTMLRIGAMNMMLHGVDKPNIEYMDSLSQDNDEKEKYTMILANPPFKGSLDYESVSNDLLATIKTKKTELLFLALFLRILKPGGRAAVIVPDGVLFGSSGAHKGIRKDIIENHKLEAVISMPSGVFKPYAGVSTAILIFTKIGRGGTDRVWFYDMQADGFSLDDKRKSIDMNDIPDIVSRFRRLDGEAGRKRSDKSFFVTAEEIATNGYNLSINKYQKIEYDHIVYDKPEIIIRRIKKLEEDIVEGLNNLESAVKGIDDEYK
ncbi:DNA methyltransferase [Listeria newyorkensis]|uniref:site-specific DNA-methyltransferase (adenine-specific) n=1 Tax=Listeria newyorkensis TaxID=1497681 RepID=A0ABX4XQC3_9LIST|nr:class I SAM-dependent DNA methyltransferase [Listeria newyorkensis]KGL44697.1 DNA methyltransferase [Listeria newyorkensis]PNP94023.1 DNA methyltransferase [Listeria newyorkensis]WAO23208.1 class I SAM-dependent DNA methyltransferase [Listeria newyorkensis]SQC50709.1 Type I restriction enzyme EcoKI M protein [Listeria newyorkensis]